MALHRQARLANEDNMKHIATTRRLLLVVVALLAAGLIWGLAGAVAASSSPSPAPGRVALRMGWVAEPDNLNPFIGYASETLEIWSLNYDYLFGFGDHNQPTLDLATQFPTKQNGGISANNKIWTIHIRSGVKWQHGVPLTAPTWPSRSTTSSRRHDEVTIFTVGVRAPTRP